MFGRKAASPWWIVFGAAVAQIVGQGPVLQFTFGVFLKSITQEFAWTRGTASVVLTLALLLTAFTVPVSGRLIDRYGVRTVATAVVSLFGLDLIAIGLFTNGPVAFILLYALAGVFASCQSPLPYSKTIGQTFDRQRGAALALALTGVGIGTIVIPQVAQVLLGEFGWRGAFVGLGILVLLVPVPILHFLIGPRQAAAAAIERATASADGDRAGASTREALRDRRLYLLGAALFLAAAAANGTIAHVVPLLTDRGFTPSAAVGAMIYIGASSIAGRVIAGYALDRISGGLVAAIFLPAAAIGVLILTVASTPGWVAVSLILLGLGLGAEADLVGYMVTRYFGTRSFGELFGYMFGAFLLASSIGPAVAGLWFDAAGSYIPCLYAFAGLLVAATVIFQCLGRYSYSAVANTEH